MLLPIFPILVTTSLLTLFFASFDLLLSLTSVLLLDKVFLLLLLSSDDAILSVGSAIEKLASLVESGDVVDGFVVMLLSDALLKSIGRLKRLVRRADENLSNWPSPRNSSCSIFCLSLSPLDSLVAFILLKFNCFRVTGGVSTLSESISILLFVSLKYGRRTRLGTFGWLLSDDKGSESGRI